MWIIDYSDLSERELEALQAKVWQGDEALKVFVADIVPPERPVCSDWNKTFWDRSQWKDYLQDRMMEIENLVTTFWWVVILENIQKRSLPDYKTYIWSGKMDEIVHEMHLQGANLLVIGNILKPHQMFNLNEKLKKIGAVAWDRVDLILKIFERNAKTEETKLQIELAAIKHMGPRIFNMWMELGKQGWKWSGETNTEIMKRHLATREKEIRKKLEGYSKVRENHRQGRKRKWFMTVGIVGYTNAGKSTLLNALTNKWVLSEDKLFATLWTSVGKLWIAPKNQNQWEYTKGTEVLLSDTIWFIRELPPELVDAFASTLEDSIESDILFHVVDASDPKIAEKIEVVDSILDKIWADQPRIYVFNKTDMLSGHELIEVKKRYFNLKPICISTYNKTWFDGLIDIMLERS